MKKAKKLWRALLFLVLLAALCGSFALPTNYIPVSAAPKFQATACSGTVFTKWIFDGDTLDPSIGNGNLAFGSGLSQPSYLAGNPSDGVAIAFSQWTANTSIDQNDYVEFKTSTLGRRSIKLSFDTKISTGTGPANFELQYSLDGSTFTNFGTARSLDTGGSWDSVIIDLSTITSLNDVPDVYIRLYGYSSSDPSGTWRFDNVTFSGNCNSIPVTNTPTATASTSLACSGNNVVISEFRTIGPSGTNDEFIELYNATSNCVDISGWKINASDSSGGTTTLATIPASTILRSGQFYLLANNGYSNTSPTPNQRYSSSLSDNGGGIGLLRPDSTISDEVGISDNSAYGEQPNLSPLTNPNKSYERKEGGSKGSCVDTNNNSRDFQPVSPSPHNYSTLIACDGTTTSYSSLIVSTTSITADTPDPSLVNYYFSVYVKVTNKTSGAAITSGKVNITGASTVCTINLNSSGTGFCNVRFSSTGSKVLTATYIGDNTHQSSSDTESHTVTGTTTFHTATPIPPPPPQLVVINEFVPRPGHDWNHDGAVNVGDEYIELLNHGTVDVNLSGWRLDDEVNIGSNPYSLPATTIKPGERIVFYGSDTGLLLGDGGDAVRLLKPNGQLIDAYNYTIARYPDESFCRLPDNGGADDWNQFCFPTPGIQNSLSGNFASPSTNVNEQRNCPISDTLPADVIRAECDASGNNIWNPEFWDRTGWYDQRDLPSIDGKWPVFAD